MSSLPFLARHLGSSPREIDDMLRVVGQPSLDALIDATVPGALRRPGEMDLPAALSEEAALAELRGIFSHNRLVKSLIGLGYYGTHTPPVIQRNVLENPGWYTAYTPYQAEISQGRLEALLNYQTMICELTALDVANASLLDEGTAAAEAIHLALGSAKAGKACVFVSGTCFPQTIAVVRTRMEPLGVEVITGDHATFDPAVHPGLAAVLVQYPAQDGAIHGYGEFFAKARAAGALCVCAADILALCLLEPPGRFGADVCVGSSQRFGVPMGFGGPHAAFMAVRDDLKRRMPGRLVGVSVDAQGNRALRLSLQTREQHIRREKATSNICTAQVLLAVMAGLYATWHGPAGLGRIASRVHRRTVWLAEALTDAGLPPVHSAFFDTLTFKTGTDTDAILARALDAGYNLRRVDDGHLGVTLDETVTIGDLEAILLAFAPKADLSSRCQSGPPAPRFPHREDDCVRHPVFRKYHTEHEMLRYLHRLEVRDIALNQSMIPLGSCTMKLNATAEMMPLSWPEVAGLHPFVPLDQAQGWIRVFDDLEKWLAEITGFAATSLQPNAGSAGEYAGLLAIREYHKSRGDGHRTVCLIPVSAHGTNPASAVMAGFQVVPVKCDTQGNIDVSDLRSQAEKHRAQLGALMVTYPSTHGVFEETIRDICALIHDAGGQVYMDGANMNAQVGLTSPGHIGADVCHLNLHKTFCIPHGGGGPGVGPICVARHLAPFLPAKITVPEAQNIPGPVAAAPWGSASILTISWMYVRMTGAAGLLESTRLAILNANYVAARLKAHFPTLYTGTNGTVAHECILDLRDYQKTAGITVEDVAKRLMDFGFHAPTMSWPVPGTLMVEPTESESKAELDRFCDAMIAIHREIEAVEKGLADRADNPLKHAPHTAAAVTADDWKHAYTRQQAAFPAPWLRDHKYWPPVSRIDNVYGDKNIVCTCPPMEDYIVDLVGARPDMA